MEPIFGTIWASDDEPKAQDAGQTPQKEKVEPGKTQEIKDDLKSKPEVKTQHGGNSTATTSTKDTTKSGIGFKKKETTQTNEVARANKAVQDPQFLESTLVLIGVLLLSAVLFAFIQAWRKRRFYEGDSSAEQFTSFRAMYEAGELSEEEYTRIKQRVAQRIQNRPVAIPSLQPPTKESNPPSPGPEL